MSELEERLNAVLNDPAELERVTRMASRLMGQMAPPPPPPSGGDGEPLSGMLGQLLRGAGDPGGKKPLLEALTPYLDAGRAARLSRALRTAAMLTLTVRAFSALGGDHGI